MLFFVQYLFNIEYNTVRPVWHDAVASSAARKLVHMYVLSYITSILEYNILMRSAAKCNYWVLLMKSYTLQHKGLPALAVWGWTRLFVVSGCRWRSETWLVTANGPSPRSKLTARHFTWRKASRCSSQMFTQCRPCGCQVNEITGLQTCIKHIQCRHTLMWSSKKLKKHWAVFKTSYSKSIFDEVWEKISSLCVWQIPLSLIHETFVHGDLIWTHAYIQTKNLFETLMLFF